MPDAFAGTASSTTLRMEKMRRAFSPIYEACGLNPGPGGVAAKPLDPAITTFGFLDNVVAFVVWRLKGRGSIHGTLPSAIAQ
jgi:hypothetical protein